MTWHLYRTRTQTFVELRHADGTCIELVPFTCHTAALAYAIHRVAGATAADQGRTQS